MTDRIIPIVKELQEVGILLSEVTKRVSALVDQVSQLRESGELPAYALGSLTGGTPLISDVRTSDRGAAQQRSGGLHDLTEIDSDRKKQGNEPSK